MRDSKPSFNIQANPDWRIAIVTASWNSEYNQEMKNSAIATLKQAGLAAENISEFQTPGAFEMPILCLKLAKSRRFEAIICFATIIRGATYHFEIVANESARGLIDVTLGTAIPILNGILACNDSAQAEERASRQKEDKGKEVALSTLALLSEFKKV